jgi:cell wall assembly regulator SMI1
MARIVNSLPAGPATESSIRDFESYIGHLLPEDYRSFLLEHNGGSPDPDAFTLNSSGDDEENVVMCFFPLRDLQLGAVEGEEFEELRTWPLHCAWDDLQNDLADSYEKEFENPLLPIGTDGSGNYFCIVLAGAEEGAVVFFEHEMADTTLLAKNFSDFLASLRQRERDDYAPELGSPESGS